MDWPAKARNSFGQAPESGQAIHCSAARIPGRLLPSFLVAGRQVNQFAGLGIFFRSFHQPIQLAARLSIRSHLAIPIIVRPRMEQRFQLATLLRRELVNRSLDFSNRAHVGKLSAMRNDVNSAKSIIVVQVRLKCHQAKLLTGTGPARRVCLLHHQNQRQELSPQFFPNLCISTDHRSPQAMFRSTARV